MSSRSARILMEIPTKWKRFQIKDCYIFHTLYAQKRVEKFVKSKNVRIFSAAKKISGAAP